MPLKAKPLYIFLDGVYVLHILRLRVGVVEPEVAEAIVFVSKPEIKADRLGMPNVEIPVWTLPP
jgi:hypothetical protein